MKVFRHVLLGVLFVGLTALEIWHGFFRLDTAREQRHREIHSRLESGHLNLAREIRQGLEEEREHAAYLSRLPAVRGLLHAAPGDDGFAARELSADLLPYLISFRRIDRVRVLDLEGRVRLRCERMGRGVGIVPAKLRETERDLSAVALSLDARSGEVVASDIEEDDDRVEVSESERQVLHFATPVIEGKSRLGVLVLTVYAAPILDAIRSFAPLPGVHSILLARDGTYLASTIRSQEKGKGRAAHLRGTFPQVAQQILSGAPSVYSSRTRFLSSPTGDIGSSWKLVTITPDDALDASSEGLGSEYAWILGSMVFTTLVLVTAGAFLVRMSIREWRLGERARYERQERELQRQVRIAEKLGSLGLLTAGVAHEINNPLEGIENYLSLLDREGLEEAKRRRYVEMVRYGFHRIRDIVRDLGAFARPGATATSAELGVVVRHALRMVGYTKDFRSVRVTLRDLDSPRVVAGDPGRLEQVFINLFVNAARAMKGEGEIIVSARDLVAAPGAGDKPGVELSVEDTGPGIPEGLIDKIFDPFFTTGDGTGLGLAISYSIISASGGSITASNREGGGARFTLILPTSELAVVSRSGERSEA